ncbi:MAG: hypothetical protein ACFB02_15870, partial [Mastigocoleus sp.]
FIGDKPGGHSRRHRNFVRTPTLSLIIALLVPVKFYKNGISSKSGCSPQSSQTTIEELSQSQKKICH